MSPIKRRKDAKKFSKEFFEGRKFSTGDYKTMLPILGFDSRTGRSTPALKSSVKAGAFLMLVGGYIVYNGVTEGFFGHATTTGSPSRHLEDCPEPESVGGFVVFYIMGVLYMFIALAIVCDEYFVPALEVISEKWNLSNDIAGATLMAAGGSAPELFTSLTGTFKNSDVGFGTIVGSAVFNVMFVIGVCAVASVKVLHLTWWPLARDCSYYAVTLFILSRFMSDTEIYWHEAFILLLLYGGYVLMMAYNVRIYKFILERVLKYDDITVKLALAEGSDDDDVNLLKPTGFRAGLYKFLTGKGSLTETAGTAIVTQIAGDVKDTFNKIDINRDGTLQVNEVGNLLKEVTGGGAGAKVNPEDVKVVMKEIDVDGDGEVSLEEFTQWYLKSEERIKNDIRVAFDRYDGTKVGTVKDGTLTPEEVKKALKELNSKAVDDEEVEAACLKMTKGRPNAIVTFEDFQSFYMGSALSKKRASVMVEQAEAAAGIDLSMPTEGGIIAKANWAICLPLMAAMLAIPDVRVPGKEKYCFVSFFVSICYIGFFSYFMVEWAATVGQTFRIPEIVMGLTILAAGTSVPDLLSSVIVAKQGHGDMAVSSSIGSNIFDILVGLPLPWLLYSVYHSGQERLNVPVKVKAESLEVSLFILIGMLLVVVGTIAFSNWRLTKKMGYVYFVMYLCYVGQELLREFVFSDSTSCF